VNEYLQKHLPETAEALRVAHAALLEAACEVSKADAVLARAERAWSAARSAAWEACGAHFAANTPPPGSVVPAYMLARVVEAINTPALEWDAHVRRFREAAEKGAVGTVFGHHRDGRVALVVRLYLVDGLPAVNPRWIHVATLEVWSHSGTVAGSGGRKRLVSEEDCAALAALAGEVAP
jgi:hypothetical protein